MLHLPEIDLEFLSGDTLDITRLNISGSNKAIDSLDNKFNPEDVVSIESNTKKTLKGEGNYFSLDEIKMEKVK